MHRQDFQSAKSVRRFAFFLFPSGLDLVATNGDTSDANSGHRLPVIPISLHDDEDEHERMTSEGCIFFTRLPVPPAGMTYREVHVWRG